MTDIINLNSIRSDNCDCNKPKPKEHSCGCHNHNNNSQPCYQAVNLGDQYFKVKNLFGELKSEWQRTEARSNLGIVDILGLEQTKESQESGGTNEWTMYTSKGGLKNEYKFHVYNGQKGDSASVEVIKTNTVDSDKDASVENVSGSDQHVRLVFDIPRGKTGETGEKGEKGDQGKSAYELAVDNGFYGDLEAWLKSLKGEPGADGGTFKIKDIKITSVGNWELPLLDDTFSGKVALWRITLANGEYFEFWVPLTTSSGGGGNEQPESHYRYNVFLFKTVTFDTIPTTTELDRVQSNLRNEVTGKTESQLSLAGWNSYSEAISEDGTQYIFMASCVVTDLVYGPWSVVRLTPMPGEKGEQGAKGDKGDKGDPGNPGTPGTSSQGLIGPTIRIRGEYNPDIEYVNETYKPYSSNTEVHFIDIVFYQSADDHGNWYSVVPGSPDGGGVKTKGNLPTNTNYWTRATSFDFAFIDTLIAQHISSLTVDTKEIRIRGGNDGSTIVAGMTSGNNVTYGTLTEALNYDNNGADSPVRIWAGTDFDTNGQVADFNITKAPFRVHQNGHLHASSAEIEGTVQANILRLGDGSFLSGTDNLRSKVLPKLQNNKIQMFYLLTDEMRSGVFTLSPSSGDKIKYLDVSSGDIVTSSESVQLKPKKLYQLFGIDHDLNSATTTHNLIWHLVEQNLASVEVTATTVQGGTVPSDCYSVQFYIVLKDTVNESIDQQSQTGTISPQGTVYLAITNNYTTDITVHVAPISFTVVYPVQGSTELSYTMEVSCSGIVVTKASPTFNSTLEYNYQNRSNEIIQLNFNIEDLAGAPQNLGAPNVYMNDEQISTTGNLYMQFDSSGGSGNGYKYIFKNSLISATYSQ